MMCNDWTLLVWIIINLTKYRYPFFFVFFGYFRVRTSFYAIHLLIIKSKSKIVLIYVVLSLAGFCELRD